MPAKRARSQRRSRPVVPDRVDFRDRSYQPPIAESPRQTFSWMEERGLRLPVLDQGETNACTGFALSNVINFLLAKCGRSVEAPVSPFMLYSMARRYDEFPGARADTGSSLRGALKGWYKHGAAATRLWRDREMPPADPNPGKDWWAEAARRPLGAYYRLDGRSVSDMHAALNESVLYASVVCHAGWDEGYDRRGSRARPGARGSRAKWVIPQRAVAPNDGGHAFVIVGYDADGFLILNSWGPGWGSRGLAVLTYEDWLDNAMDCWIGQLGVVTEQHREVAAAKSLRIKETAGGREVALAADPSLRNHEISPFIVDMANNGRLSQCGEFRTNADDLTWLLTHHLDEARKRWRVTSGPVDIAVYAHGGLVGERGAAETAARWIPVLYEARVFPIFFMWETDIFSTLANRFADLIHGEPKPTGALRDTFVRFWNSRLEKLLSEAGSFFWDEMKQNARAISAKFQDGTMGGGRLLFEEARTSARLDPSRVRIHLIGHSAGAIVHCHLAKALLEAGWSIDSVSFMAPACTTGLFLETIGAGLGARTVGRYAQFHLSDELEVRDPTCRPILGYGRSLLYLVSESFEHGRRTPILGMEKFFRANVAPKRLGGAAVFASPSDRTRSTTHGGFDDDGSTRESVIAFIKKKLAGAARPGRPRTRARS